MNTERYQQYLDRMTEERRREVLDMAQRLIEQDGIDEDRALFDALRYELGHRRSAEGDYLRPVGTPTDDEISDPDISLGLPHGPEGESHGGRDGRDPLQATQEATPGPDSVWNRSRTVRRRATRSRGRVRQGLKSTTRPRAARARRRRT